MLDFNYSSHYAELVRAIPWQIQLPSDQPDFFQKTGVASESPEDKRVTQRRYVRVRGLMAIEQALPSIQREHKLIGVYTKDFSKDGCGIISPIQWFPGECVRLILPTFWLLLSVERCRRIDKNCYEIGLMLLARHDPDRTGFIRSGRFLKP